MSSLARPQIDEAPRPNVPVSPDAGKIERPYAEDHRDAGGPSTTGTAAVDTAKSVAKGYGDKLADKAAESRDSLTGGKQGTVIEKSTLERRVQ